MSRDLVTASWEMVYDPTGWRHAAPGTTYRLAVPGGWLYRVTSKGSDYNKTPDSHALCFVADPMAPHVKPIEIDPNREPLPRTPPAPYDPDVGGPPYGRAKP